MTKGGDLWKEQEELREYEEQTGLKPKFGPNSKGIFVHTLLALYKDPYTVRKMPSQIQSDMKKQSITITKYEARKGTEVEGKLWCCITQHYHSQEDVWAAHIVQYVH